MTQERIAELVSNAQWLLPELVLVLLLLLVLVWDLFLRDAKGVVWLILAGLLANSWLIGLPGDTVELYGGLLVLSPMALFFKQYFHLAAFLTVVFGWLSGQNHFPKGIRSGKGEYYLLIISALLGLDVLAMSNNLLMVYLSIELVSLSSYSLVLFAFDQRSTEGTLKYFLFGAFSSGLMLYGMSLLYGLSGTLEIGVVLQTVWQAGEVPALFALLLTFSGLLFKVSAVPFHVWAPDVYESAPTPVVAFMSVAPKGGGVLILLTMQEGLSGQPEAVKVYFGLATIALLSIFMGNLAALWQTSAKRMLAYSSIAHGGFMLVAVIPGTGAAQALAFYVSVFLLMNFAAFFLIAIHERFADSDAIATFGGVVGFAPWMAVATTLTMVALAGVPITAGFTAKLLIFSALWQYAETTGYQMATLIVALGLGNIIISLVYYLKLPYQMIFQPTPGNSLHYRLSPGQWVFISAMTLPLLLLFFQPDWLLAWLKIWIR